MSGECIDQTLVGEGDGGGGGNAHRDCGASAHKRNRLAAVSADRSSYCRAMMTICLSILEDNLIPMLRPTPNLHGLTPWKRGDFMMTSANKQ